MKKITIKSLCLLALAIVFVSSVKAQVEETALEEKAILYYSLEEDGTDNSGNGYDAFVEGATFEEGKFGNGALVTSDEVTYIATPEDVFLYGDNTVAYTIAFWFKVADSTFRQDVCQPLRGRTLLYTDNGKMQCYHQKKGISKAGTGHIYMEWTHVAIVIDQRDGTVGHKLYINGELAGVQKDYGPLEDREGETDTNPTNNVLFGGGGSTLDNIERGMDGMLDEIFIFNDTLSAEEIMFLQEWEEPFKSSEVAINSENYLNTKISVFNNNLVINNASSKSNEVIVFDISGKQVLNASFNGNSFIQNLNLEKGIYIVKLQSGFSITNKKVMVK